MMQQQRRRNAEQSPSFLTTFALAGALLLMSACTTTTKELALDGTFPIPLISKSPVQMGIHLDQTLTSFTHVETIDKKGSWSVALGPAQQEMFGNLAIGIFENHAFVDNLSVEAPLDGVLKPTIREVQFALPSQTRSDYYEVWISYHFELYDRAGTPISEWKLPAYGKASKTNYASKTQGLQAAAMAACRDAMAFFSINFSREPAVRQWINNGKPLMPAPPDPSNESI